MTPDCRRFSSLSGRLRTWGTGAWRPQFQISQAWNFIDNLNWLKGSHSFKFGYQYLKHADNFFDIEAPQGLLAETGAVTASPSGVASAFPICFWET